MEHGYRSPNLVHYSRIVAGWLTKPDPEALATQVAGWEDDAWEATRWVIQVHGVGPLLHHTLAQAPHASALHPRLRSYLAEQYRLSGERVALLLGELAEVLDACRAAGLTVMPLKGALLATRYYPAPGLRPMNDLDLMTRPEDEPRLIALLARLGYQPIVRSWKHLTLARPAGRGPIVAWDGEHPANPRGLDLHIRLTEQFWGLRYDLTGLAWDESEPGMLLGVETRLMRPAALLHHLAIHASGDMMARRIRLLHIHDIALVAQAVGETGWRQILAWAHEQRERRLIYPALAYAGRYSPAIPPDAVRELRAGMPPTLLGHLDAASLEQFSYCNSAPSSLGERLIWFRPGREQIVALRHMALPDADEIASWYPALARPMLLPLAYTRYVAEMAWWGTRRALGLPRINLVRRRASGQRAQTRAEGS